MPSPPPHPGPPLPDPPSKREHPRDDPQPEPENGLHTLKKAENDEMRTLAVEKRYQLYRTYVMLNEMDRLELPTHTFAVHWGHGEWPRKLYEMLDEVCEKPALVLHAAHVHEWQMHWAPALDRIDELSGSHDPVEDSLIRQMIMLTRDIIWYTVRLLENSPD